MLKQKFGVGFPFVLNKVFQFNKFNYLRMKLTSNKGTIFISLSALILIFFSTLIAFFFYSNYFNFTDKTTDVCRHEFINQQKFSQQALKSIFQLNPLALSLYKKRKIAEKIFLQALRSGNPKAIAAASANLASIISQQTKLDLLQKKIINSVYLSRLKSVTQVTKQIHKIKTVLDSKVYFNHQNTPKLELIRTLPSDLAPTFDVAPNFTHSQQLQLNWKSEVKLNFFNHEFWTKIKLKRDHRCNVSLIQDQNQWKPALIEGKLFLSY